LLFQIINLLLLDTKMTDPAATRVSQLRSAFEQAAGQGQQTVYTGAAPAKQPALPPSNPK
jgi:hypothetical protein